VPQPRALRWLQAARRAQGDRSERRSASTAHNAQFNGQRTRIRFDSLRVRRCLALVGPTLSCCSGVGHQAVPRARCAGAACLPLGMPSSCVAVGARTQCALLPYGNRVLLSKDIPRCSWSAALVERAGVVCGVCVVGDGGDSGVAISGYALAAVWPWCTGVAYRQTRLHLRRDCPAPHRALRCRHSQFLEQCEYRSFKPRPSE
jgi:hypothetical protein